MRLNPRTRRFFITLGLLVLAGVVIRLIVSAQLIRADTFVYAPPPETDQATYLTLSEEIISGKIPEQFYYQPFYYSVFLPAARLVFRSDAWSAALAQTLCSAFIIWLAGLIGAMLKGRTAGLIAGFFAAFTLLLILYVPYALLEIQQCLHITLLIYLLLRCLRKDSLLLRAAAGLVLACAILSRGNAWCFLPVILLVFEIVRRRRKEELRTVLLRGGVFLLCVILPQLPFAVRNSAFKGCLTGPSTAGPAVLALGNTPEAPPRGLEYPETYEYWMAHQEERSVPGRILDWAFAEPAAFLEFQIRKFCYFWDAEDVPNNISMQYNGRKSAFLATVPLISSGMLMMFFLAGFLLSFRDLFRRKDLLVLYSAVFLYACATAAFYILARFRVPAYGLIAAGCGVFPVSFLHAVRRKDWRGLLIFKGGALGIAAAAVFLLCPVYAASYEPAVMRLLRPHGVCLIRSETARDLQDTGPRVMGYAGFALKNGITVTKSFSAEDGFAADTARLRFFFVSAEPADFYMSINGAEPEHVHVRPGTQGYFYTSLPHPAPPDRTFRIVFGGLSREVVFLAADPARNYGRTAMGEGLMPFEAAIRLLLEKNGGK